MLMFTLQQKHRYMIYQDYFRNSDFEDIWVILNGFYLEHEEMKPLYSSLVETIKSLPIKPEYSTPVIQMRLDSDNEIVVIGAPDPQEWLIGREVEIDFSSWKDNFEESVAEVSGLKTYDMLSAKEKRQLARESNTATLAAHLLYWSTLYAIKTQEQHSEEFSDWLDSLEKESLIKYEREKEYISESFRRKQRKYWRETVANDSPIDWVWNLGILKKKIEYNIGFWRYVQRHVGWEEDVKRMLIAVELLKIAKSDYPNIEGKYINERNSKMYTKERDYEEPDMHMYFLSKFYRDKAFHILWRWLDHNMKKWWD